MGVGWNSSRIRYFDDCKSGKIKFIEVTTRELIDGNLLQTSYEKLIDREIAKTEIDTTKFKGY